MTLSVVIATFGRAQLVRETVLAALAQSRPPDEVVVSDDASPDDTVAVLEELARREPRLKIVRQPVNLGGVDNWNAVIDASQGELVAWCSDDDLFAPEHLARAERHLIEHPECDLVHGWFSTLEMDERGGARVIEHPRRNRPASLHGAAALPYLVTNTSWPFHASTMVFRRSLWQRVGRFDPRYRLADTDWFLRCALEGRIDFLAEVHVQNRRHPGNWSNRVGAVGMHAEVDEMARAFIARLGLRGLPASRRRALSALWTANQLFRTARLTVARGRAGAAEQCAEALQLMVDAAPGGSLLPKPAVAALGRGLAAGLSRLQRVLPGGAAKYSGLGVTQPK